MDEPSSGRTYDPKLGRFLQADPFIQAAGNTQSYNRYSYVVNNPLNKIDPSGYISLDIMKGVRRAFFKMIGPEASQVLVGVGSIFCGPFAPLCAAAGSYDASRANGASMAEAMHTATYSGVSAAAFNAIGGIGLTPTNAVLASGLVGGTMAYGQGGKFGHGFLSAGIGAAAGAYNGEGVSIQGFVVSSVAGGTASYLTGGKFGNGAATAAFSYAMTWGVKKYGAGGDPQDRCASKGCGAQKNLSEEERKAIKLRINELAKNELSGVYGSADAAALAIHNNRELQHYLTNELGVEGWAVIDGSDFSIKEISTGFSSNQAAGVYDSSFSSGDYVWHSHPSGKNVHGGDLYSAWNKQASGIYASGKNLSYMQSNSAGTGGFFKTVDQMRDYRGKYSIPMRVHMNGQWRYGWSDETKY